MSRKRASALAFVLTLVAIISATPTFGQSSMSGMSDQNMGSMGNMSMSQRSYNVTAARKNFTVLVGTNGKLATNPSFNETQKSIIFSVSGIFSQAFVHYEIMIPADLLGGNLTTTLGGVQLKPVTEVNGSLIAVHITVPNSFVTSNNISDSTTLTIGGTQAIPEFPISVSVAMLVAFAVSSLVLIRRNKFNLDSG